MTHSRAALSPHVSPAVLSAAMVRQCGVFRRTEETLAAQQVAVALAQPWMVAPLQWTGDELIAPAWSPDDGALAASSADLSRQVLALLFGAWDGCSGQQVAQRVPKSVNRLSCAGLEVTELDWADWVDGASNVKASCSD